MTDELSFASGIQDVDTLSTFESITVYGPSGVGKSNLLASAIHAGYKRVLVVDIEGTANGLGRLNPGVKRIVTPTFQHLEAVKNELLAKPDQVDFVIFDGMNRGGKMAVRHFQSLPVNANNKYAAWDDLERWASNFMWSFHHSPIPTGFIFHPLDEKNEQTGAIKTTPKFQGSFTGDIPTISDIVGYYNYEDNGAGGVQRVLYVGETLNLVTKNRFGLPAKIVDPTVAKINELIAQSA